MARLPKAAARLDGIEMSMIRQISALGTPLSANLGIGEPNVEPDETLRDFAHRATLTSWHYSPNPGTLSLRRKISEGTDYDARTETCVTAGTQEAIYAIFQAYVNPGDEVLVPNPGFVAYATVAAMCGATAVPYDLQPPDWTLDASRVHFTKKTRLIVVNSPSNPLGAVVPRATLEAVAAAAEEQGALVVSDEVYSEIWYEEAPASMAGMSRNVLVVNGMSKSHAMTGLRLGWILARAEIMKPVMTAHQYITTCASVFSQALAELVLGDAEWNRGWVAGVRSQFATQREAALSAISREIEVSIPPPAGAFYAFVPVPTCDTLTFAKTLATDAAVLVIPGRAFGAAGEGFVRISFAASLDAIGTGIERIGRWLRADGR